MTIIRRFLDFMRVAKAVDRVEGARALAKVFLYSSLNVSERQDAELALTWLLDDRSPEVRRALAEVMAAHPGAPRSVILGLAQDQPEIAAIVLARSPLLVDAELVDRVAEGCARVQRAIAERRPLARGVAAALAEVGCATACAALLDNDSADIALFSLARLSERHGEIATVRALLLDRPDLPLRLRQRMLTETGARLRAFVAERAWLDPARASTLVRDATDRATLILADRQADDGHEDAGDLADLVAHLAETAQLTPVLLLRALCLGHLALFEEALVRLSGLSRARVAAIVHDRSLGYRALHGRAGLPAGAVPVFEAARLAVLDLQSRHGTSEALARQVIERVLTQCHGVDLDTGDHLLMLLRRFALECERDEARRLSQAWAEEAARPALTFAA